MIATLSLMRHTDQPLHIYVLTAKLNVNGHAYQPFSAVTAERMADLMRQENPQHRLTRIDITDLFMANPPQANMTTMFTPYCMLRLYADLIPELPDRVLYLDTDIVCRRSFSNLYQEPMKDVDIAGVLDHYGKWWFHHKLTWFDYINSGVLLMNLAEHSARWLAGSLSAPDPPSLAVYARPECTEHHCKVKADFAAEV